MCARTTCRDCGKPDWRGCGAHVDQVLRDVPAAARCRCREDGTRQPVLAKWWAAVTGKAR